MIFYLLNVVVLFPACVTSLGVSPRYWPLVSLVKHDNSRVILKHNEVFIRLSDVAAGFGNRTTRSSVKKPSQTPDLSTGVANGNTQALVFVDESKRSTAETQLSRQVKHADTTSLFVADRSSVKQAFVSDNNQTLVTVDNGRGSRGKNELRKDTSLTLLQ